MLKLFSANANKNSDNECVAQSDGMKDQLWYKRINGFAYRFGER